MALEVRPAREEDAPLWDRVVQDSPHGTIFHRWKWLRVAERHSGFRLIPLICFKGERPVGLFPLFHRKWYLHHLVFSPPPSTVLPFLGPVMPCYQKQRQEDREREMVEFLQSVLDSVSAEMGADHIDLSLPYGFADPRPFSWAGFRIIPRYDYEVDLGGSTDELWYRLNRNSRRNVQEARERGFSVGPASRGEIAKVHDLLSERYRAQQRCFPASLPYFQDLYDAFPDDFRILAVRGGDEILSGMIQVRDRDRVWAWVGFPRPASEARPSPNDLLTWEAIARAREEGAKAYITVGAAGNPRLHWYYASKCDPVVRVRYAAQKTTPLMDLAQHAYLRILRPLRGRLGCR
jgi:hypothetical protein